MGFPVHKSTGSDRPSICVCHADDKSVAQPTTSGYFCPQCGAKYCNVPIECRLCHLTLVSAPQLARAYQHLVPLPTFEEIDATAETVCHGCCKQAELKAYRCKTCHNEFCIDCDLLLHESLQTCPGCNM
uniref:TFIIH C1-like domain-containing protein n=1 Tax=Plectus sambesii TaxID=2011161 RepID=A0A914UQ41_9BILA